jgi:hypothetical protein
MSDLFVRMHFFYGPLDKAELGVHPETIQKGYIEFGPDSLGIQHLLNNIPLYWIHRYTYKKDRFVHTDIIAPPKKKK